MKKVIISIIAIIVIAGIGIAIFMLTRPKTRTVSINLKEFSNITPNWNVEVMGDDNPSAQIVSVVGKSSIIVITYKKPGNYELILTEENGATHNYKVEINENGFAKVN